MRLIDADAYSAEMKDRQKAAWKWRNEAIADEDEVKLARAEGAYTAFTEAKLTMDKHIINPWHSMEKPPKWVSVFDDLPRHNAVVVVSDGKRSWDVGQYHFLFKADDRTIWWWKKHTTRKVLWWMYKEDAIPEPPKEDA